MAPTTCKPMLVAIAGGSGSGKTTLARAIADRVGADRVFVLSQDSYYHDQSARFDGDGGSVNFDHPSAIDFDLLAEHLRTLAKGQAISVPVYDFATHTRAKKSNLAQVRPLILIDGTLVLSQPKLVPLFDYRVFIDVPEKVRFERRMKRDTQERGRDPEGVRKQFERQVAPMHNQFVQPSSKNADIVLTYNQDMDVWIQACLSHLPSSVSAGA